MICEEGEADYYSVLWNSRHLFWDLWDTHFFLNSIVIFEKQPALLARTVRRSRAVSLIFADCSHKQVGTGMCVFPNLLKMTQYLNPPCALGILSRTCLQNFANKEPEGLVK